MNEITLQLPYYLLNIVIASSLAFFSHFKLKMRGGRSILILSVASLFCYAAYLRYLSSLSDLEDTIRTAATLFGMTLASTALYTFSLEYTHRSHWIKQRTLLLFAVIPIFTQVFYWAPETINLFQKRFSLLPALDTPTLLEKVNILYSYSLIISTVWLLGRTNYLQRGLLDFQFWLILTGPLIAFVSQGLLLINVDWEFLWEFSFASINLSAIGFSISTFKRNSNLGLLVRRGSVVENMEDGWIVLDAQNSIVDLNQATANLIALPREKMYGESITSILSDFPDLLYMLEKKQEIETDRTIKVNGKYRYLNIRALALNNKKNTPIGRLVIWRDITDRRRAEDARQQARDEMFVLLNAISNAASQTANLKEFLSDAIYQIIYPFRSQFISIYILDERENPGGEDELYLAAHMGLSSDISKKLNKLPTSSSLYEWIKENRQHLLLEDSQDQRVPESIQALNLSSLLVIPLHVHTGEGKKVIGLLILGRKEISAYKQDEIIRLSLLADQIATLIDSDRRRKLAISLSERQRLMRDVHDSVSQKLYGLVTLTEAAQAAIEAKSDLDWAQVLSRIGENARQAVKELRLFLFQMQPIDLEREGLISVLHHRLAAVEGRADIKVRFVADEPIYLSKRKEIALYFIAQEALNNILRHAQANSVSVILKQGYKYVTFEVSDDGCGFEQDKLEQGGLGLKNIKERVRQENGKIKISSKTDEGTIIKVTFEKDVPSIPKKNNE